MHFIEPDWPCPPNVRAYTTTRHQGHSQAPFDSFNLGENVDDNPQHLAKNRELLIQTLQLPTTPYWINQVHGTRLVCADTDSPWACADAAYSQQKNRICCVTTADCLPVLVCNKQGTIVCAIHAGWRGLCAGIIERCLQHLKIPPRDTLVWLGPAIGPLAFEVNDDVRQQFLHHNAEAKIAFCAQNDGKWVANIYLLARQRLKQCQIDNIYGGNYCTWHEKDLFYSYRRETITGRMASLIWIMV